MRQVTFELTFAQRDLVWLGDPGSPTATVSIRQGSRPLATDVCVATSTMNSDAANRRYLREARIVEQGGNRTVHAFTRERELPVGTLDTNQRFTPNENYIRRRDLLPSWPEDPAQLRFDPNEAAMYCEVKPAGPAVREALDFLPLDLRDSQGQPAGGTYFVQFYPGVQYGTVKPSTVVLRRNGAPQDQSLAMANVPASFRREQVLLGSYDNRAGTYLPESAYRPGGTAPEGTEPSVTFTLAGQFTDAIDATGPALVLSAPAPAASTVPAVAAPTTIAIDGNFDDWRNIAGVDDPRGDLVPYLDYVADVDLLEFKVAHDERHLYLYARVAGQVGRTHPDGGRSYFYAYLDVDQNSGTGFLPTRDDDCYFGVDIGDDCEVQFEFVNNAFRKTFYGFCGLGGDDEVLRQIVKLGPSQYGRLDEQGREREHYKAEYTYRDGRTEITEDLKLGTSDTIRLAVSPDGREVEIASEWKGFLKDADGRPILGPGQTIDLAAGMESDSQHLPGKTRWGADSTRAIRAHSLK
ncbi:MAG: hypothetical protein K1X74_01570 [Pirellulales bacterium]|nr:hypothetical protein [Pirellulales bacterium]